MTSTETLHVNMPGTSDETTLTLSDTMLVGRHAEIYRAGNLWWVRDLGSEDGIYLDEELIDAAPITRTSVLRIGSSGPAIRLS